MYDKIITIINQDRERGKESIRKHFELHLSQIDYFKDELSQKALD